MRSSVGITGARGVLGRRIVDALARSGESTSAFSGDVRDRGEVEAWIRAEGFETVVHSAAVVPVELVQADPGTAIAVNVGGTANVAGACADAGKRLVYISTAHIYAPHAGALNESATIGPVSLYGLTKLQGEEWCREMVPEPLILRVFSFFDEWQPDQFLVPSLYHRLVSAEAGSTLAIRGITSTRDLASATWLGGVIAAAALSAATGTVNCGTGIGSTIARVAEILRAATGRDDVRLAPADQDEPTALTADIARLRQILPALRPFDLTESLTDYVHGHSQ